MRDTSPSQRPSAKRRILIVDDHPLVRRGLTALIDSERDITVCAAAAGHRDALEVITPSRPDLVITDLSLGDGDGLELVQDIRSAHEDLPVLVLTMHDGPGYAKKAFRAGTDGYVTKREMNETLLVAIRKVLDGEMYVSARIREGLDTT